MLRWCSVSILISMGVWGWSERLLQSYRYIWPIRLIACGWRGRRPQWSRSYNSSIGRCPIGTLSSSGNNCQRNVVRSLLKRCAQIVLLVLDAVERATTIEASCEQRKVARTVSRGEIRRERVLLEIVVVHTPVRCPVRWQIIAIDASCCQIDAGVSVLVLRGCTISSAIYVGAALAFITTLVAFATNSMTTRTPVFG